MGLTRIYLDEHCTGLGTFEWDIVNPDRLTNLEIKKKRIYQELLSISTILKFSAQ